MDETGLTEVRAAARTFNTMQGRLARYIQDRTRVCAAMSHDLKTPITRLRLRVEMLDDSRLRAKCIRDLNETGSMVTATLDFMRGAGSIGKSGRWALWAWWRAPKPTRRRWNGRRA